MDVANLRKTLLELLDKWAAGALSEKEMHESAESLWEERDWPDLSPEDEGSVVVEALCQLDMLNAQWITKNDIPVIRKFLNTPPGQTSTAWVEWSRYWDNMDMERRRAEIADNAYYIL